MGACCCYACLFNKKKHTCQGICRENGKRATSNLSMIAAFTDYMNDIIAEPGNVDGMVFLGQE
jgi:hypothetical protein